MRPPEPPIQPYMPRQTLAGVSSGKIPARYRWANAGRSPASLVGPGASL